MLSDQRWMLLYDNEFSQEVIKDSGSPFMGEYHTHWLLQKTEI